MVEVARKSIFWNNKRVLITGHTGFVGSWLTLYLRNQGATIIGFSRDIPTKPSLYEVLDLDSSIESIQADIRDYQNIKRAIDLHNPEVIFHLAAQSIVKESFRNPLETLETNTLGTINLLESVRQSRRKIILVNMTSDKCYENVGSQVGYEESDALGGRDIYSSSKACSELLTRAYRDSFFSKKTSGNELAKICSIRAGNIIGGGDWSAHRLIPDCIRAFQANEALMVRSPDAVRPWQHVLDIVNAFLILVEQVDSSDYQFCRAWNIGPNPGSQWSVRDIVEFTARHWNGDATWKIDFSLHTKEEELLTLNNSQAKECLGWQPIWNTKDALEHTIDWYIESHNGQRMVDFTVKQITQYFQ
jgi:CDP-glucose 4,6-dehydratase